LLLEKVIDLRGEALPFFFGLVQFEEQVIYYLQSGRG
jgi:hypothetical protein